ncbi:hypothetical protein SAMN04489729_0923 [Amycolatopsis lurida]|uniref:Lipoprotein n=1 Tax=Amycolatopsis lurida NRRL 2430 TaxID=1460371 RepID=A0A2P2G0M4_AMYLU|nr:hypothetical protein [Amycolatopsis lurida]KFU82529.1 hypothetical protein BB31_06060 [Amycolatopsis lurida NRRL 2430]SEB40343.1 hypothetical protein SAMN04489729_0923 [Amycolatopsis lurida]
MKLKAVTAVAAALTLAACGSEQPGEVTAEVPHGYVEGAEEAAEAQSRLIVADTDTGAVRVVDLITEEVHEAGRADGVRAVTGDGRFGYLTAGDGTIRVIDSGSWMVDHGDHVHYYRTKVRDVGVAPGNQPLAVYSDPAVTALSYSDGTTTLLDRTALDKGTVTELGKITREPHAGVAIPYREHIIATVADAGKPLARGVRVHDRQGKVVAEIDQPCPDVQGQAVTRRGAVFGCADGALLVTEKDGAFAGVKIPYPRDVSTQERATAFSHRPGGSTLAARAGESAVWSLDVGRRSWQHVETGPVAAVNAVGEGGPLLVLTRDGKLRSFDGTGKEQTAVPLLTPEATAAGVPSIQVDSTRAYLNNPLAAEVYEIDYNDNLRRARTLKVGGKAGHIVETGR